MSDVLADRGGSMRGAAIIRRSTANCLLIRPEATANNTVVDLERDHLLADTKHKRFIDLAHPVEHGMITYKGMPGPVISDYRSREDSRTYYAEGAEFHIGRIEMIANTGTYIDSPFHRYANGADLSQLSLKSIADLPGICIAAGQSAIDAEVFENKDLSGRAVLVHTGWSRYWRTEKYAECPPFLTRDAAAFLVEAKAALVGIDSMNIDDIHDKARPVHSLLLKANIQIVEHLTNLAELPAENFRFFAIPPPVKSFGSFAVRAFAIQS
jgi:arylformamidase